MKRHRQKTTYAVLCALLLLGARGAQGYAVLTHEAIIDATWDQIKPILLERYPNTTPDDLKKAHAYTYGGCIIQDMGYYPFGSHFFSDLTHYVRSGDFVIALLRDAQNVNELAFAIGALAHYAADNTGHPVAVNRAVAIEYPKLRAKYGNEVTYGDDPAAHLKTEFGFDVVEIAQGTFASEDYHDFIGFQVAKELLERAFRDTYSLELKDQFHSLDLALGTYRRTVSTIIPDATKVAWEAKKKEIVTARPGMTKQKFLYNIQRSSYEKEWGNQYEKPGFFSRFFAFLFRIFPKIGPFKSIAFQVPTQQTEKLFMQSFNQTLDLYRGLLRELHNGTPTLENRDFDTGKLSSPGEYRLADETFARLTRDLAKKNFSTLTPELYAALVEFYRNPQGLRRAAGKASKKDQQAWRDTQTAVAQLQALSPPGAHPAPEGH